MVSIGDTAKFSKTISESDIYLYAGITGDFNPAHIDEEYASSTFFKKRVCHGMLLAGFISNILGTKLPGPGTIYMSQDLNFLKPVYIGDTITTDVHVVEIITSKQARLATRCLNQDGEVVVSGHAVVSLPREG